MKSGFAGIHKILLASVSFTILLLIARLIHTHEFVYTFYPWNLFLALIPFVCGKRLLSQTRPGIKAILYLAIWLLFLPNAPYLITDLFHFKERPGCPLWFDLILVSSGSWNGIMTGTMSLIYVEQFLKRHYINKWVQLSMLFFIALCGYGVYLGRFLRFNSWDVITDPIDLAYYITNSVIHPHRNVSIWAFTLIFSLMFGLIFFTVKGLQVKNDKA